MINDNVHFIIQVIITVLSFDQLQLPVFVLVAIANEDFIDD